MTDIGYANLRKVVDFLEWPDPTIILTELGSGYFNPVWDGQQFTEKLVPGYAKLSSANRIGLSRKDGSAWQLAKSLVQSIYIVTNVCCQVDDQGRLLVPET